MSRAEYFEKIEAIQSPLLLVPARDPALYIAVAEEAIEDILAFADRLSALGSASAKTRATFIKLQCKGLDAEDLFDAYCESWGIPRFDERTTGELTILWE